MEKKLVTITNQKMKDDIFEKAKDAGKDWDGDIIHFGNKLYYCNVLENECCEILEGENLSK